VFERGVLAKTEPQDREQSHQPRCESEGASDGSRCHKEEAYQYPELASKEGVRSLVSVPMILKDTVIG
jgi:hypothetical protein